MPTRLLLYKAVFLLGLFGWNVPSCFAQITPTITASGPTAICNGDSVVLTAAPQAASYSYLWLRGTSVIIGANGPAFIAKTAGTYKVIINSPRTLRYFGNGYCSDCKAFCTHCYTCRAY